MERELKELKGAQLQGKMAMGDKDEFIERIEKDKERLNGRKEGGKGESPALP